MQPGEPPPAPAATPQPGTDAAHQPRWPPFRLPLRARDIHLYRFADDLTAALIYALVVFGPWAFGTTQSWSLWTMNSTSYALGLLLALKLIIRWFKAYQPPRWQPPPADRELRTSLQPPSSVFCLAFLTLAILVYCLVSALNARATFDPRTAGFTYHPCLRWLPHSFDSTRTWQAFWTDLGLACAFWAIRDWLLGKTDAEARAERGRAHPDADGLAPLLPARLRHLLWVLTINGALLGAEGILQRFAGSGRLLFLVQPRVNPGAETQFGPYAYRANAAQYFNLLWPVCLGFWWTLNLSFGRKRNAYHLILAACTIMAACPIISSSRGGAIVTVAIALLATGFLLLSHLLWNQLTHDATQTRPQGPAQLVPAWVVLLFLTGGLALGLALGWKNLGPRLAHLGEDSALRQRMYDVARPMAADYPLFGTGPGTFETVFQLYRISTDTYWPAQLHNDWLETRITFGWIGSGLIALTLLTVLLRWFTPGGIGGGRRFLLLIWLAIAGCLVHARYDFPFQVHSIVFLFLTLCAIASVLSRRP